ncbi:hypothetical protein RHGRI_035825 [Rhododendron griersonianum]|uniref:Uncharacterized protein n=1 Tax=Rhododendron griersonianum TaxID=479676 RepID=A0AAV6HKL1_9ERIC|nr:hypothetical protein RHGRI_035825 [Rhododendron griersonianum]
MPLPPPSVPPQSQSKEELDQIERSTRKVYDHLDPLLSNPSSPMDTEISSPQNKETSSSPSVDIVMETPQVTQDQGSLQTHTAELSFKAALVQPKRLSQDEIQKRIADPLVGQASTSSPIPIVEQPTPVLIPIVRKTPQYTPKHLHPPSLVSAASDATHPNPTPNLTTIPQPGQAPQVSPQPKPPDLTSLTTATYHEYARNAEADAQGRQGEEDLRSRDRSTSPHRDRMVGGRGKHENNDKRGYRRGPISAQGEIQTSVETPSLSQTDP